MSKPVHRLGDANDGGGVITSIPQGSVYANGKLVSVNGSIGTGHSPLPPHTGGGWTTANGSSSVFIEGKPVNRDGDSDSCGHKRIAGSNSVNCGG